MTTPEIKFDPWDWLGVHCGGYFAELDSALINVLECIRDDELDSVFDYGPPTNREYRQLICTLLCNTDAFAFDDDPTQLRFVGDDRFQTLDQLVEAWDTWYGEHYG